MSGETKDPGQEEGWRNREGVLDEAEAKRQAALLEGTPDISGEERAPINQGNDEQRQELLRKLEQEQNPGS